MPTSDCSEMLHNLSNDKLTSFKVLLYNKEYNTYLCTFIVDNVGKTR